VKELGYEFIL